MTRAFTDANGGYYQTNEIEVPNWAVNMTPCDVIPPPEPMPQSKEERIQALQVAYEIDLEKLNNAWLSALIADGAGEVARQATIKQQMIDLEAQLEIDILNIIMEE